MDAEPFMEVKMMTELNKMHDMCPHFVQMHHWHVQNNHVFKNRNITNYSSKSIFIYTDKMDNNCFFWSQQNECAIKFKVMMFQILFALMAIHKKLGFVHGDAHIANVLYKNVTVNEKSTCYCVHHKKYYVPNTGQHWFLTDFGRSRAIDMQSKNKDEAWADTPSLEFVNFLKSLLSHAKIPETVFAEIQLLLHFISQHSTRLHCIFDICFSEFSENSCAKDEPQYCLD